MNRRGNMLDAFLVLSIVAMFAIGMLLFIYVEKKLNTGLNTAMAVTPNSATSTTILSNVDNQLPWTIDFFVIMLMFGLPLLTMILAFFNNISPVWFWASIGFSMLIIVAATWYASIWSNFTATSDIGVTASTYMPMTNWVMNNYVTYAIFCIFVLVCGIYVKTKDANGGYSS